MKFLRIWTSLYQGCLDQVAQNIRRLTIQSTILEAMENGSVPFENIVKAINPKRHMGMPFFNTSVNMLKLNDNRKGGGEESTQVVATDTVKFLLNFMFEEHSEGLWCRFEYRKQLFSDRRAEEIFECFTHLLHQFLEDPTLPIKEYNLVPEKAIRMPPLQPIHLKNSDHVVNRFLEHVNQFSESIAVSDQNNHLSFKGLDDLSNRIAGSLIALGVGSKKKILLGSEPSVSTIAAIFAIWKIGAIYCPVDLNQPPGRLIAILNKLEPSGIIVDPVYKEAMPVPCWFLNDLTRGEPIKSIDLDLDAYIITTSGSTGVPKGVLIPHSSLMVLYRSLSAKLSLFRESKGAFLMSAPLIFDASIYNFLGILSGHRIHCVPYDILENPKEFLRVIEDEKIHSVTITPTYLNLLFDHELKKKEKAISLTHVMLGGEAISRKMWEAIQQFETISFYNGYGPTEYTVLATVQEIRQYPSSPVIGLPLPGCQIAVVDENLYPLPPGAIGEILTSGPLVAKGYVGEDELNKEKFIETPFSTDDRYKRAFRTGDLGSYNAEGYLSFHGRLDNQFKINGLRIETGDIETAAESLDEVSRAIVVKKDDPFAMPVLCLYYSSKKTISIGQFRDHLSSKIPSYMIPNYFIRVKEFPRTRSGKTDLAKLPVPSLTVNEVVDEEIKFDSYDKRILLHWEELFPNHSISLHSNFFELGGHSLLAIKLMSKIRKEFQFNVRLKDFFENPTPFGLKGLIKSINIDKDSTLEFQFNPGKEATQVYSYSLSSSLKLMWFLWKLAPEEPTYNIGITILIPNRVDTKEIDRALRGLVKKYSIFRSTFHSVNNELICKVLPCNLNKFENFCEYTQSKNHENQKNIIRKPFDLQDGRLFRCHLYQDDQGAQLTWAFHHIVMDEWSMEIVLRDFFTLMAHPNRDVGKEKYSYHEFVQQQTNHFQTARYKEQLTYWKQKLNGVSLPYLPFDKERLQNQTSSYGRNISQIFSKPTSLKLAQFSERASATPFAILFTIIAILIHKYSRSDTFAIGIPGLNREFPGSELGVGCFINPLTIKVELSDEMTAEALVTQVKEIILESIENIPVPFDHIIRELKPTRADAENPLFNTYMNFSELASGKYGDIDYTIQTLETGTAKFPLTWIFEEHPKGLSCILEYRNDLFSDKRAEEIFNSFLYLLNRVLNNPTLPIGHYPLISQETVTQVRLSQSSLVGGGHFLNRFNEQLEQYGGHIAVSDEAFRFTYHEIDQLSDKMKGRFIEIGVKPHDRVLVGSQPSAKTIGVILALWKMGGVYCPVDLNQPLFRLKTIIEKLRAVGMVIEDKIQDPFPIPTWPIYELEGGTPQGCETFSKEAYVITTSGSTGTPKGVSVSHDSLMTLFLALHETLAIHHNPGVIFGLTPPLYFDASITFLLPLLSGSQIHCFNPEDLFVPRKLFQAIQEENITVIHTTPTFLEFLLKNGLSDVDGRGLLKHILIGGEAIPPTLWESLEVLKSIECINVYGPTECVVNITAHPIKDFRSPPTLGRPLPYSSVDIVDPYLNRLPPGAIGEMIISGPFVSEGYVNEPEENKKRFIHIPWNQDIKFKRGFRTGDLGSYRPNGFLDFHGRLDNQVKINGLRIELGEIEAVAEQFHHIGKVIVRKKDRPSGDSVLCLYYASQERIPSAVLRDYLASYLPYYMVPNYFIHLDMFPRTPNGKVNLKNLPPPSSKNVKEILEKEELDDLDASMIPLWQEIFPNHSISLRSNFFQLGGHSFLAITLISKVRDAFSVDVSLKEFLLHPTPISLKEQIKRNQKKRTHSMNLTSLGRHWGPASEFQKGMFSLYQSELPLSKYHVSLEIHFDSLLNPERLYEAFTHLVCLYPELSTQFEMGRSSVIQKIVEEDQREFEWKIIRCNEIDQKIHQDAILRPLDLLSGLLMRVTLFQLKERSVLLLVIHHIVVDERSTNFLLNGLAKLYSGEFVEKPKYRFLDYLPIERQCIEQKKSQAIDFWKNYLQDVNPFISLFDDQRDFPTIYPAMMTETCSLRNEIISFCSNYHMTPYHFLLGTFMRWVRLMIQSDDFVISSVFSTSFSEETKHLFGPLINVAPIRYPKQFENDTELFFKQVLKDVLDVQEHAREVPFNLVVPALKLPRKFPLQPYNQILFTYQNNDALKRSWGDCQIRKIAGYPGGFFGTAIALGCMDLGDIFSLQLTYQLEWIDKKTMKTWIEGYMKMIQETLILS
ncbi:MAG: AMP-binding protein [Waddliaceae bacterium]